ncbi:helix-turn-helix domain-containing protein [Flavisphingomonas formosensis]|uniref:helix-turn-helix domain-containing protein n=1 Tax=Flavisphingomonas formosensis TaxID=861534 RepID=UPI0012F9DB36|nr:cupin domain-containing protein [Sphingomonas formosensis]
MTKASVAVPASDPMMSFGALLRDRRKKLRLTLNEVALRSGLSVSFISLAERGKATPSIVSLSRLAQALEIDLSYFLTPPQTNNIIHRAVEPEYYPIDSPVTYIRLSAGHTNQKMDSFIFVIPPGPIFPRVHRDGESFYYMLEGELHFEVGQESFDLGPGDNLHFDTRHSYTMQNRGTEPVRVLWVGTPVLFPAAAEGDDPA